MLEARIVQALVALRRHMQQVGSEGRLADWVVNSHKKLTFDRIIPGARDGMMFADFSCFPYTLIF